ncbi:MULTISPECIES: ABC transporter substrate-binding protein [Planococcus]|uniref:Cobalamin-binding protein n=1 Tax=Planococcus faecalis TaxID=1598147 RepID=A0ABN4XQG4_9BACL|nr:MULTISPECIES: ABC transporter substrate-binding protein [Planococcus]AQU79354.1 cobalamin-binding protein [Planococcus faecalis]MDJ0333113.1 ABC transporter substrate-binding protein [Planococcus sp. S3-L1]OHX51198.1 cobalamin-binding protein [Planococcus faecalis]
MKISSFKYVAIGAVVLTLGACQSETTEKTDAEPTNKGEEQANYTVTDDLDNELTFEKVPKTVVSLIPSNTEILYGIGAGEKVIGATDYDNYPAEAAEVERISDSVVFNAERIIEMDPDVVIGYSTGAPTGYEELEAAGIQVFVIESAQSFEDVYGDIEQISTVMGLEDKGDTLNSSIQQQIEEVQEKIEGVEAKKQVFFEISPSPEIYTAGQKTFQQEILNHANVENIFGDLEGWPKISEEEVITRNPEIITTTVSYTEDPIGEIKAREGWSDIEAIQNDQVFFLDSDITSRPGPRIGDAVELVAKTIYPDLFN